MDEVRADTVVYKNHKPTSANLGPAVNAINIWKNARAGYLSPVVALTLGNHSYKTMNMNKKVSHLYLFKCFTSGYPKYSFCTIL